MSKPADKKVIPFRVRFATVRPAKQSLAANTYQGPDSFDPAIHALFKGAAIRDRYVYVFSATGSAKFGISTSTPGWESRTAIGSGWQHMARLKYGEKNPEKSGAPAPDKLEYEIYIDESSLLWTLPWKAAYNDAGRHKRPHPKWGTFAWWNKFGRKAGECAIQRGRRRGTEDLALPLLSPDKKEKRYYFLLSDYRLGPHALRAALSDVGTDGLSLLFNRATSKNELIGYRSEDFKKIPPVVTAFVVDAHEVGHDFATALEECAALFFGKAEDPNYLDATKKVYLNLDKTHLDEEENQGTIDDLFYIATTLKVLRKQDANLARRLSIPRIDDVLDYRTVLEESAKALELRANHLANWLSSPLHRILDIGLVKDVSTPSNAADVETRADALLYWYRTTRLLNLTRPGLAFLADACKQGQLNPIADFLDTAGKWSTMWGPISVQIGAFVPDLLLYALYRDMTLTPEQRVKQVTKLLNASGYFKGTIDTFEGAERTLDEQADALANAIHEVDGADVHAMKKERSAIQGAKKSNTYGKYITKLGLLGVEVAERHFVSTAYRAKAIVRRFPGAQEGSDAAATLKNVETWGQALEKGNAALQKRLDEELATLEATLRKAQAPLDERLQAWANYDERLARVGAGLDRELAELSAGDPLQWKSQVKQLEADRAALLADRAAIEKAIAMPSGLLGLEVTEGLKTEILPEVLERTRAIEEEIKDFNAKGLKLEAVERARLDHAKLELQARAERARLEGAKLELQARADRAKMELESRARPSLDRVQSAQKTLASAQGAEKAMKARTAASKKFRISANGFLDLVSLALDLANRVEMSDDPNAKGSDRFWNAADIGKDFLDLYKDLTQLGGVDKKFSTAKIGGRLVNFVGMAGGAYYVWKYGAATIKAWNRFDLATAAGSALIVAGGGLGIYVGYMEAAAQAAALAPGYGWASSFLIATGTLLYAYAQKSDLEWYTDRCYFSSSTYGKNERPGNAEPSFLGELVDGREEESRHLHFFYSDVQWGVRAQRAALERLMSCYRVSSEATAKALNPRITSDVIRGHGENAGNALSAWEFGAEWTIAVTVDAPSFPAGSWLEVALEGFEWSCTVTADELAMQRRLEAISGPIEFARQGATILHDDSIKDVPDRITVRINSDRWSSRRYATKTEIVAKTRLVLPDHTAIVCRRVVITFDHAFNGGGGPAISTKEPPTIANTFEGAVERPYVLARNRHQVAARP